MIIIAHDYYIVVMSKKSESSSAMQYLRSTS
jgi:hypothetical protein